MANERIIETINPFVQPVCNGCKNYKGSGKCTAFPSGIPVEILTAENKHSEPLLGQMNDITFEKK